MLLLNGKLAFKDRGQLLTSGAGTHCFKTVGEVRRR